MSYSFYLILSSIADMSILKDLSVGYTDESKLGELVVRHNSLLKHALRCKYVLEQKMYSTLRVHSRFRRFGNEICLKQVQIMLLLHI